MTGKHIDFEQQYVGLGIKNNMKSKKLEGSVDDYESRNTSSFTKDNLYDKPSQKEKETKKDENKKKEPEFHPPLPLETEIDDDMIQYVRDQGIKDPDLLRGRMSEETCNLLNHAKLKHRSCK